MDKKVNTKIVGERLSWLYFPLLITFHYFTITCRSFQDYTQHLIDLCFGIEHFEDINQGQYQQSHNLQRILQWKQTQSFLNYAEEWNLVPQTTKELDIGSCIRRLRYYNSSKIFPELDSIFREFISHIHTEKHMMEVSIPFLRYSLYSHLPKHPLLFLSFPA